MKVTIAVVRTPVAWAGRMPPTREEWKSNVAFHQEEHAQRVAETTIAVPGGGNWLPPNIEFETIVYGESWE